MTLHVRGYVSTVNFGLRPLSELTELFNVEEFPAIEISSGHPYEAGIPELLARAACRREGAVLLHNNAPPVAGNLLINLADPRAERRAEVITFLKSTIVLSKALGADYYSFHAGYRVPYRFGVKRYAASERLSQDEAMAIFIEALREVLVYAESQGVRLGVENHVVEEGNETNLILYAEDDFERLFQAIRSPFLCLHLDVGHLKVTSQVMGFDRLAFIRAFADKIVAVHLHDNDGVADQHRPLDGRCWVLPELERLPALRHVCLETRTGGDMARLRAMADVLVGYGVPVLSGTGQRAHKS